MNKGFSLVELMVSVAIGTFLLLGIVMSYSAIKGTIASAQELASAQEVLRYTQQILSRSIKQTASMPTISANGLTITVQQDPFSPSCQGTVPTIDYDEVYTLRDNYLTCDIVDRATGTSLGVADLLRGVQALTFSSRASGLLVDVTVTPENVPTQFAGGIVISLAATRIIMVR
ncbi:PilW family protein [Pseudoalteromonas sp. T1lg65]|uniref:PilW family protein n=1 Tax=Pseudoalteromonas sp. T1lg65 TaxID=2077101 RepID=UPI003F78D563